MGAGPLPVGGPRGRGPPGPQGRGPGDGNPRGGVPPGPRWGGGRPRPGGRPACPSRPGLGGFRAWGLTLFSLASRGGRPPDPGPRRGLGVPGGGPPSARPGDASPLGGSRLAHRGPPPRPPQPRPLCGAGMAQGGAPCRRAPGRPGPPGGPWGAGPAGLLLGWRRLPLRGSLQGAATPSGASGVPGARTRGEGPSQGQRGEDPHPGVGLGRRRGNPSTRGLWPMAGRVGQERAWPHQRAANGGNGWPPAQAPFPGAKGLSLEAYRRRGSRPQRQAQGQGRRGLGGVQGGLALGPPGCPGPGPFGPSRAAPEGAPGLAAACWG